MKPDKWKIWEYFSATSCALHLCGLYCSLFLTYLGLYKVLAWQCFHIILIPNKEGLHVCDISTISFRLFKNFVENEYQISNIKICELQNYFIPLSHSFQVHVNVFQIVQQVVA